jgi:hypothetical protein
MAVIRRAYAKLIMAAVCVEDVRVEGAFASVRREDFLGPGPWPVLRRGGYFDTPDADPIYLYADIYSTASLSRHGAVFQIERDGTEFRARWISAVGIYPCEGGRDEVSEAALDAGVTARFAGTPIRTASECVRQKH